MLRRILDIKIKISTLRTILHYGIGISVFLFFIGICYLMIKYPPPVHYYDFHNIEQYPPHYYHPITGAKQMYAVQLETCEVKQNLDPLWKYCNYV
mgnify:CR=1 FL=1